MSIDSGWATQNVANIFPQDEALSELRNAAWGSYIRYCRAYDNVFDVLLVGQADPDFLVFERLAVLADRMPQSTVECLELIIENDRKGLSIYSNNNETKIILATAIKGSNNTARQTAIELINHLGQRGNWEFRELLC